MKKLVTFISVFFFLLMSCDVDESKKTKPLQDNLVETVLEAHPSGKPKAVEYSVTENGKTKVVAFKEFYESGNLRITGRYGKGKKRDGLWESFHDNGNKWSIGNYVNGVQEGEKKVWYENGKIMYQGQLKADKPAGTWEFFDTEGNKTTKKYE